MLQRIPWVKVFAAGPEDPLNDRHKFFRMICLVQFSMRAHVIYDIKRHNPSPNHLRQDQRYREELGPDTVRGKDARTLQGSRLAAERKIYKDWAFLKMEHQRFFIMIE